MRQLKITKGITNRESQSLETYLKEIGREGLVSGEEEVILAQRIREGDQVALEKLTKANLRFVVSVAKQYQNQGLSLSDLINEGNLGLIKAARRFDETRGFKFISYAVWWIRQSILHAIAEKAKIVRVPLNRVSLSNKIKKACIKFQQDLERELTNEEISEVTGYAPEVVLEIMDSSSSGKHLSLDAPVRQDEEATYGDYLLSDFDTPDNSLLSDSIRREFLRVISTLTPREAEVIVLYFGIGHREMTLDEIGSKFDLSRERVRQIKETALRRLRHKARIKVLKRSII